MDKGNIVILMVHFMMVNGRLIKCKVKVNIIIMIHWFMMENGLKMNFMGLEENIIMILIVWLKLIQMILKI